MAAKRECISWIIENRSSTHHPGEWCPTCTWQLLKKRVGISKGVYDMILCGGVERGTFEEMSFESELIDAFDRIVHQDYPQSCPNELSGRLSPSRAGVPPSEVPVSLYSCPPQPLVPALTN
jgi:hypothetical protein